MTKSEAVQRFHRQAEMWQHIAIACLTVMIGLMLYVGWLHIQVFNCYAGVAQHETSRCRPVLWIGRMGTRDALCGEEIRPDCRAYV